MLRGAGKVTDCAPTGAVPTRQSNNAACSPLRMGLSRKEPFLASAANLSRAHGLNGLILPSVSGCRQALRKRAAAHGFFARAAYAWQTRQDPYNPSRMHERWLCE